MQEQNRYFTEDILASKTIPCKQWVPNTQSQQQSLVGEIMKNFAELLYEFSSEN